MARCSCSNPCTCYVEYDGDRPNTPYTSPFQYGRYNSRKKGTGSASDPYIIEFLDSEEFPVEAAKSNSVSDHTIANSLFGASIGENSLVIDYETPYEIFIVFQAGAIGEQVLAPSYHRFWMVSAQATFVYNGTANGSRGIFVNWSAPTFFQEIYPSNGNVLIAGTSTSGTVSEDLTISCSGFSPFIDRTDNPFAQGGVFLLRLQQTSGSNMTVRDISFSIVAL